MDDDSGDEAPALVEAAAAPPAAKGGGAAVPAAAAPVRGAAAPAAPLSKKIPVTILSGFLGSGKSSLLRAIVSGDHGLRVAVVENEFGATGGLESAIASDGVRSLNLDGSIVELRNGCVCCSVKGELVQALEQLVGERAGGGRKFDGIVVELSGVANPGPVASSFWLDAALESILELDAVVNVVDCSNFLRTLAGTGGREARQQVAFADRVLMNKCDLVDSETRLSVEAAVSNLNPTAERRTSTRGEGDYQVDGWILRTGCFGGAARTTFRHVAETPGSFAAKSLHETPLGAVAVKTRRPP
ncbi:CobW/HypB/UreG, nucleotide-binding domain-containing protein [Pelagophyceae sp. CCMP2097]|nr:CobW/HypB/UreG, nucleotide-binding domain-containing protein [Pelagophyceae sp. CCMP2097]